MNTSAWLASASIAILGLCAGAASAATATFDFTTVGYSLRNSISYASGDLGLVVTGQADNGSTRKVAAYAGNGIGVSVSGDSHTIDSIGTDDIAVLTFSKAVRITSLAFKYITEGSRFDFRVGPAPLVERIANVAVQRTVTNTTIDDYMSTAFGIEASPFTSCWGFCTRDSEFKLAGVTVSYEDPPAPVPVPAAGALLVGALGALGALRRRT